jgi:hypothetical protein
VSFGSIRNLAKPVSSRCKRLAAPRKNQLEKTQVLKSLFFPSKHKKSDSTYESSVFITGKDRSLMNENVLFSRRVIGGRRDESIALSVVEPLDSAFDFSIRHD